MGVQDRLQLTTLPHSARVLQTVKFTYSVRLRFDPCSAFPGEPIIDFLGSIHKVVVSVQITPVGTASSFTS
jgi:hypothetical protein